MISDCWRITVQIWRIFAIGMSGDACAIASTRGRAGRWREVETRTITGARVSRLAAVLSAGSFQTQFGIVRARGRLQAELNLTLVRCSVRYRLVYGGKLGVCAITCRLFSSPSWSAGCTRSPHSWSVPGLHRRYGLSPECPCVRSIIAGGLYPPPYSMHRRFIIIPGCSRFIIAGGLYPPSL